MPWTAQLGRQLIDQHTVAAALWSHRIGTGPRGITMRVRAGVIDGSNIK